MTLHHLKIAGCTPTPLASYLKALGILRIVSEQFDPQCRGWWQDEQFHLMSRKPKGEIEAFFLEKYEPTPFVSPWNKGCGFFKANDPGLVPIENSKAKRFHRFRSGITASRSLLDAIAQADAVIRAIKACTKRDRTFQTHDQRILLSNDPTTRGVINKIEAELDRSDLDHEMKVRLQGELAILNHITTNTEKPSSTLEADRLKNHAGYKRLLAAAERHFKALKDDLLANCRLSWRGPHAEWLSSAVVLGEEGDAEWPSLVGTGGSDGNLDFTNNFMQRLGGLFDLTSLDGAPKREARGLLRTSLWGELSHDLEAAPIGQFMPGSAGGFNSSTGFAGNSSINPWDFLLMLEGVIILSAKATKLLSPNESSRASAPFAIRAHAAGFASPGTEKSQRGEQWMPLWPNPSTLPDVKSMFGEARLQLKRALAARPIDAARAISRLGTARGIESFIRYGYLERNGQSTLAVPLGRIRVRERPSSRLIDDIATWVDRIQLRARDSFAPTSLKIAERNLSNSILNALSYDDSSTSPSAIWQSVLESCADIEALQKNGLAMDAGPIPQLSTNWITLLGDDIEIRLALSLAGSSSDHSKKGWPIDSIRRHWLPLKPGRIDKFNTSDKRLAHDPRVVMQGRSLVHDCVALINRRLIEAEQKSLRTMPLVPHPLCGARLDDIAQFIAGNVDDQKISKLSRALMALRWDSLRPEHLPQSMQTIHSKQPKSLPDDAWLMLRLVHLPHSLRDGRYIPTEPSVIRLLHANSSNRAIAIARRRLLSVRIRPPIYSGCADSTTSLRWAAALAFPLSTNSIQRMAEFLDPSLKGTMNV